MHRLKKNAAILYHGQNNRGKSTILNLVIDSLRSKSMAFLEMRKKSNLTDRWAAILYRSFWITIGTYGDTLPHVEENFKFAITQGCTICVTASHWPSTDPRLSHNTKREVAAFVKGFTPIDLFKEKVSNPTQQSDLAEAKRIIKEIDALVTRKGAARISSKRYCHPLFA